MVSFKICEGNPGALVFLMHAYKLDPFGAEVGFQRMAQNYIRGTQLYMLWNDCCFRVTPAVMILMQHCPIEKLKEHINYEGGRGIPFTTEELNEIVRCIGQKSFRF